MIGPRGEGRSGDLAKGFDDGAVVGGSIGEFDVALYAGPAEGAAGDIGCRDLGDAGGCYGDSKACSYETQDCEPLWGFLDNAGAEAVFFAE